MQCNLNLLPMVLPAIWSITSERLDGYSLKRMDGIQVIISSSKQLDGKQWLHVSLSKHNRLPKWDEIKEIKNLFIGKDKKAIQVFPAEVEYVNIHPYVLHLWHCQDGDPLPDFTQGSGSL